MGFLFHDIYRQIKRRARLQKAAFEAGLNFDGKGFGTVTLSGVHIGRKINFTYFRQSSRLSKAFVATMEIFVETKLPYSLELKPSQDYVSRRIKQSINPNKNSENPKTIDEAFSIFSTNYPEVQPLLNHPVVEAILLELERKMNFYHEFLSLLPEGITYHTFTDWIHDSSPRLPDVTEPVFKLAMYLSQPNHLAPVASVSRTLEALNDALAAGSNEVAIEYDQSKIERPEREQESNTDTTAAVADADERVPPSNDAPGETIAEQKPAQDATTEGAGFVEPNVFEETAPEKESQFELNSMLIKASESDISPQKCASGIALRGEYWIEQTVLKLADYRFRSVSRQVLEALNERAVPVMIRHLNDFQINYELKSILNNLGSDAARVVVEQLDSAEDEDTIRNILEITSNLRPEGAVEKVKRFLKNDNYSIRNNAERTLRRLGLDYDQIERMKGRTSLR